MLLPASGTKRSLVDNAVALGETELLVTQRDLLRHGRLELAVAGQRAQRDVVVLRALHVALTEDRIGVEQQRLQLVRPRHRTCLLADRLGSRRIALLERGHRLAVERLALHAFDLAELLIRRTRERPVAAGLRFLDLLQQRALVGFVLGDRDVLSVRGRALVRGVLRGGAARGHGRRHFLNWGLALRRVRGAAGGRLLHDLRCGRAGGGRRCDDVRRRAADGLTARGLVYLQIGGLVGAVQHHVREGDTDDEQHELFLFWFVC